MERSHSPVAPPCISLKFVVQAWNLRKIQLLLGSFIFLPGISLFLLGQFLE
jgi:hypothetical protein